FPGHQRAGEALPRRGGQRPGRAAVERSGSRVVCVASVRAGDLLRVCRQGAGRRDIDCRLRRPAAAIHGGFDQDEATCGNNVNMKRPAGIAKWSVGAICLALSAMWMLSFFSYTRVTVAGYS